MKPGSQADRREGSTSLKTALISALRRTLSGPLDPGIRRWVESLLAGEWGTERGQRTEDQGARNTDRTMRKGNRRCSSQRP
jgi:hypothetical protein